jgi:TatD family hydrolase
MYAAVGIHPEDCHFITDPEAALAELSALLKTEEVRKQNKIVALGEIGLDYHWQSYDNGRIPMNKELQSFFFNEQMKLAEKLSLPVIIHDREAHGDCFETVLRYPNVKGVFHSYSGSAEMAHELTRRGWYISFSGTLTFTNARKVAECALKYNSSGVILCHNHPSGGNVASESDRILTNRLCSLLEGMEIHVIDHIIAISSEKYISMSDSGIMPN